MTAVEDRGWTIEDGGLRTISPSPPKEERGPGGEGQTSLDPIHEQASGSFAPHAQPLSPFGGEGSSIRVDTPHDSPLTTHHLPLVPHVDLFAAGINGALNRIPQVTSRTLPLAGENFSVNRWDAHWPRIKTIRLTFPAGVEFLPPPVSKEKSVSEAGGHSLMSLVAPGSPAAIPPKHTRIKPPDDAISLEDRLFYLLQPPLESWLKGQELIMPHEPFPFQKEGIAWLFSKKAALLADEMGLGKTMQAITAIRLLLQSGQVRRVLLVCPKPLIPNWLREFKLWAEELPVVTVEGDSARRQLIWTMPGMTILLANYELLVRDMEALGDQPPQFDLVILDEAQRIKNRESQTATTTRSLPRKRSWALTGTPIENRTEELASLYEYMEVVPPRATPDIRQLTQLSKHYILRRTKDLVMKDLPPRLDRDEILELSPAQRLAYDTAEKEGVVQLDAMEDAITIQHVFELVLRLKQITNFDPLTGESAKFERLEADMEEIAASGGKAILFSQWTQTIDWLEQRLQRFGALVYHGKVPTAKREPILAQFKNDPDKHLILMSYGTGAVGLNLQFAGYVFLFDRWWNPAVEDQAINRAHRIGQKTQVIVTKFISKDTIEERIDRVLQEKRELFATVLGEGNDPSAKLSLSATEIFGLFNLKARHGKGTKAISPPKPDAVATSS